MRRWGLIAMPLLCGCVQSSLTPVEPAPASEPEPAFTVEEPSPTFDASLDPEIAALLTPEALAAAAEPAEPEPPDPRTPSERAREACERRCARAFSRDPMIRRIIHASRHAEQAEDPHGPPPELSDDEDGLRRFVSGEPSTIWLLDGSPSGQGWAVAVYINPDLARATFPFHGLLFEIDADDRVLRCRYAERDHPDAAVDMACPR